MPSGVFPRFLALLCFCVGVHASDYYVSPQGNDLNPGTQNAPFQNVSRGVNSAGPGDRILLMDGTYGNQGVTSDGTGGYHGYASPVKISKSGTPDAWITLKAVNRGSAILDCGTTAATLGCDKNIILNRGAAYWSFEDLVFTGGAFGGIGTDAGASNIRVKGCRFENIGVWNDSSPVGEAGIGFDVNATNWTIEGNVFHDIGRTGGVATLNLDHGIYAAGTNVTIINNLFYNINKGWSLQIADGASNWLIANNTFAFASTGPGQIMLWKASYNVAVQNNIFYNPTRSAIDQYAATVNGCTFDHNLVYGASSIISGLGIFGLSTNLAGCGGTNLFGQNPGFMNVAQPPYDFHLSSNSPAIGTGVQLSAVTVDFDGNPRPQGGPPAVGAFEPPPPVAVQSGSPSATRSGPAKVGSSNGGSAVGAAPTHK